MGTAAAESAHHALVCVTSDAPSASSSSSSPSSPTLITESVDGGRQDKDHEPADPLLRTTASGPNGENEGGVYELREGVGRKKPGGLALDGAYYSDEDVGEGGEEQDAVYTPAEERAVVRKFDRRLVMFVALLYLLGFLDRSNIGNAYAVGMDADLLGRGGSSSPSQYEWALSAFYVAYIAFEWLALLWGVIPAHVYIAAIVASWGVIASLQAVVGSYPALIVLRFALGIGEAGLTGIPIYLSYFFRREELALRTAVFISAAPLATAFASSLAWLIIKLGEAGPIAPWRLLFLLEGFPAVLVATVAWRVIPDSPQGASYLTAREKQIAKHRLLPPGSREKGKDVLYDSEDGDDESFAAARPAGFFERVCRSTLAVLADPIPWTTAGIFFLTNVAYSSLPVFLPSILAEMGHTPLASQALAAPPYLVAFAAVLAVAKLSDALQARALLIAAAALASAGGYGFLALARRIGGGAGLEMARYLAVYPAAGGFFCVVVLTIAWNINNARGGGGHKGGGFALMQAIGQCGPLLGTRLYPKTDGPWYERGMGVCAAAMLGVAVLALGLRWRLKRMNRRLDGNGEDGADEEGEGLVRGRGKSRLLRGQDDGFRYML